MKSKALRRPLNVVYFMNKLFEIDGAAQILLGYARNVNKVNYTPTVVFIHSFSKNNQYLKELIRAGIPVLSLTHHPLYYLLRIGRLCRNIVAKVIPKLDPISWDDIVLKFLSYYLRHKKADILHVMRSDPGMPIAIKAGYKAGIPILYQEMGAPRFKDDEEYFQTLAKVLPLCTSVAALSHSLAAQMATCVPFWVKSFALPLIYSNSTRPSQRRNRQDAITVGFAARLDKLKGAEDLVEAVCIVNTLRSNPIRLLLVGDGPERSNIISKIEVLKCGHLVEVRPPYIGDLEKEAFLREIDILALPSYTEGTPNSIIEAMAHSLPVVAYSVGGIPDILSDNTGRLVKAGDINALASALSELSADQLLRERLGRTAKGQIKSQYSVGQVLCKLEAIYQETCSIYRKSRG
jgi:glycosyltransferase involved in cell wall biosynthesis